MDNDPVSFLWLIRFKYCILLSGVTIRQAACSDENLAWLQATCRICTKLAGKFCSSVTTSYAWTERIAFNSRKCTDFGWQKMQSCTVTDRNAIDRTLTDGLSRLTVKQHTNLSISASKALANSRRILPTVSELSHSLFFSIFSAF